MTEQFTTSVDRSGDATVIRVRGEIDMATAAQLRDAIEPHLGPRQTVVLDFAEVTFIGSACLRVLVQARGTLTADGGSLYLRNPSTLARRMLSAVGAEDLLEANAREREDEARARQPETD